MVDIDRFTGEIKVRRFYALDDCGTRINPMVIEGQIHGGLTEAFAVAMGQHNPIRRGGNHLGNRLMDYILPTATETPHWETYYTVTPCPHHPIGAKGVAESPHWRYPRSSTRWWTPSRTSAPRTWTCPTARTVYGTDDKLGINKR